MRACRTCLTVTRKLHCPKCFAWTRGRKHIEKMLAWVRAEERLCLTQLEALDRRERELAERRKRR